MKRTIRTIALALALALLAGCSLPASSQPAPTAEPAPHGRTHPPSPPPTPAVTTNPLTGETTGQDYTNQRPVAVTLRTADGATPYWGLSAADLVIEGVSEGYDPMMVAVFAPGGRP